MRTLTEIIVHCSATRQSWMSTSGTAAASDIAIFSAAEAHRVAMEASADPAAYDFTGGWPPMFGA